MAVARDWVTVAVIVAVVAILAMAVAWKADPELFEKRSGPVVLTGITRTIAYDGSSRGNVTGALTSGCAACPLTIEAGDSATVWLGGWYANISYGAGPLYMNWTVTSPYPFEALAYSGSTPPLVYSWSEHDRVGPYGGGGFGTSLTFVIPYSYSGLPPTGNVTFVMVATQVG